jgi:hypothetical protein
VDEGGVGVVVGTGVGDLEEGCRVARTNSGEGMCVRWERMSDFQGAGGVVRWVVVVDMVERRERRRRVVRAVGGAMAVGLGGCLMK